jgi:hypothetical protein
MSNEVLNNKINLVTTLAASGLTSNKNLMFFFFAGLASSSAV